MSKYRKLFSKVNDAQRKLEMLRNPMAQKVLKFITKRGEVDVTDIYCSLRIEQAVASFHLANLRICGVVNRIKKGKRRFYSPNFNEIQRINDVVSKIL